MYKHQESLQNFVSDPSVVHQSTPYLWMVGLATEKEHQIVLYRHCHSNHQYDFTEHQHVDERSAY